MGQAWEQLDQLLRDVRYAGRSLRKSPVFAVTAIVTLALGIGANTAIFSALQGVVLAPLPYRQPDRLVMVLLYNRALKYSTYLSFPDFVDWQRESRSFEQLAAFSVAGFDLTNPGTPEHVEGKEVSSGFFDTLGVPLALGRTFSAAEDRFGGMPAVVISNRLWQSRFSGEAGALGKAITLNGAAYTIVGVLPRGFRFDNAEADVYTALGRSDPFFRDDRTNHNIACIARLAPGINIREARAELNAVQERIDQRNPTTEKGLGTSIYPLKDTVVGDVGPTLLLLLAAVGLVLLIACANVANLLLARSAGRVREIAVRLALGASRAQIVRQLVSESVLLSLAGGGLGLMVAKWGLGAVLAAAPGSLPRTENIGLNVPVLLFALIVSMLVGVLFGLAPAWKDSNADLQIALKSGGRGSSGGQHRAQAVLAVVQIALALVLLSGASLLFRTIQNLWAVNPGFDATHVVTFQVGLSPSFTRTAEATRAAYQQLVERIGRIPGVEADDITALLPLAEEDNSGPFWIGSRQPASMAEIPRARYYWTGPDYLSTLRIPLLRGRFVSRTDNAQSEKVIAIDSVLARTYFPDRDPVGQTVTVPHWGEARIVGVVGHVEHSRLDGSAKVYDKPEIYGCFYQLSDLWIPSFRTDLRMVVRTRLAAGDGDACDQECRLWSGKRSTGLQHPDNAGPGFGIDGPAALSDDPSGYLRGSRVVVGLDRNLRRDLLLDGPARTGDWHSPGVGSDGTRRNTDAGGAGPAAGFGGGCDRGRGGFRAHAGGVQFFELVIRGAGNGSVELQRGRAFVDQRGSAGLLYSGPACGTVGANDRASPRLAESVKALQLS